MWGRRRRRNETTDAAQPTTGRVPVWQEPDRSPARDVERLRVDGTRVRVNTAYTGFAEDARGGLALLRTDFVTFAELSDANPLTRLYLAGVAQDPVELSTLCCLRCYARHSLPGMMIQVEAGREPVRECLRCASPDALLVYDPDAAAKDGAAYDMRSDDAAGLRVERFMVWASSADLPPSTVQTVLDLADHGEEVSGAHVEVLPLRSGDSPTEAEMLAQAVVYQRERDGALSPDALLRMRTAWLRMPDHGDVLVVVITAPG